MPDPSTFSLLTFCLLLVLVLVLALVLVLEAKPQKRFNHRSHKIPKREASPGP